MKVFYFCFWGNKLSCYENSYMLKAFYHGLVYAEKFPPLPAIISLVMNYIHVYIFFVITLIIYAVATNSNFTAWLVNYQDISYVFHCS